MHEEGGTTSRIALVGGAEAAAEAQLGPGSPQAFFIDVDQMLGHSASRYATRNVYQRRSRLLVLHDGWHHRQLHRPILADPGRGGGRGVAQAGAKSFLACSLKARISATGPISRKVHGPSVVPVCPAGQ